MVSGVQECTLVRRLTCNVGNGIALVELQPVTVLLLVLVSLGESPLGLCPDVARPIIPNLIRRWRFEPDQFSGHRRVCSIVPPEAPFALILNGPR